MKIKPIKKQISYGCVPIKIYCECGKSISYDRASDNGWHIDTEGKPFGAYLCPSCLTKEEDEE